MSDTFLGEVWSKVKIIVKWGSHNLLAPILAVVLIALALFAASLGIKNLQIGGILGKLLGKKSDPTKKIEVINSIDSNRIDPQGNLIPVNQPDSKGVTQVQVVPIEQPSIFSDPNKVTFTPPGQDKPIEIVLPDGVTNKDVDKVIVISPTVVAVTVKDESGITSEQIDDLLKKY